jgi:mannose-6-phosphate isomerase-like protein (cupin superfamily)
VRLAADAVEFWTDERCHIRELSNGDHDPQVSVAQARVEPGVTTRWHSLHGIAERYCILAGRGQVEVGELPAQTVGPGDLVLIPAGCRQRIRNIGHDDLVFLAICSPRFRREAYRDLSADD